MQMSQAKDSIRDLENLLIDLSPLAIAVSGGIDSMTLAVIAGRIDGLDVRMIHAVSWAVPKSATQRVQRFAKDENWHLRTCNAGEFADKRYLENPFDRCYYCKSNLYGFIASDLDGYTIVSGTNLDDLQDFRPGLKAAQVYRVRHPYVEVKITKAQIRNIASHLNLHEISKLPASPCLSSRVETGIPIKAQVLTAIDQTETCLNRLLEPQTVRCRVRSGRIVVELDDRTLKALDDKHRIEVESIVARYFLDELPDAQIQFAQYSMGSAFVANPA